MPVFRHLSFCRNGCLDFLVLGINIKGGIAYASSSKNGVIARKSLIYVIGEPKPEPKRGFGACRDNERNS